MGNYHVPFCRAVGEVTLLLTLIIGRKVGGNDFIVSSPSGCVVQPVRIRPYKQKI
jgi:hypothetical protein